MTCQKWLVKIYISFSSWKMFENPVVKKVLHRGIVHHRWIFYYKRQFKKCIKNSKLTFFSSLNSIVYPVNDSVILSHCITRFCRCIYKKQTNPPRRGITFEESFLRNGKRGAQSDFAIHPRYLFPNDRKPSPPMIAIGRPPIPLSTASRMSTSSTAKTVNYNEAGSSAATCGGERGLSAGDTQNGEREDGGRGGGEQEGEREREKSWWRCAREGRGKRAKTERPHHHGRNPTSHPRRRSCLSVYSSVYSRGRRPQSIDFTPVLPPPSPSSISLRAPAVCAPLLLLQHFPADTQS